MGIITWQNVPAPDLTAGQVGLRTASDLFDRAARGALVGTAQMQAVQDAQKKAEQDMADKVIAAKMLAAQDPEQYKQMLASGQFVDPTIARAASVDALLKADAHQGTLSNRALVEQSLNDLRYKSNRMQAGDRASDAAGALVSKAIAMGVNKREDALKLLDRSGLQFDDRIKAAQEIILARIDPDAGTHSRLLLEDRATRQKGLELVNEIRDVGDDPAKQLAIFRKAAAQNPLAAEYGRTVLDSTGENFSQRVLGTKAQLDLPVDGPDTSGIEYGYEDNLQRHYGDVDQRLKAAGLTPPGKNASIGDVLQFNQDKVLPLTQKLGYGGAPGVGTTASGPAQLLNSTWNKYGEKALGKDWKAQPYTLENIRKVAKETFNNEGLGAWEAFKSYPALAEQLKGRKYEDVEPIIFALDGGVHPARFKGELNSLESSITKRTRNLSDGGKAILAAQGMENKNGFQVASEIAKVLDAPDAQGEILDYIRSMKQRAAERKTADGKPNPIDISDAEIGGLLLNSMSQDGYTNWSDIKKNLNVLDSRFQDLVDNLSTARADVKKISRDENVLSRAKKLREAYDTSEAKMRAELLKSQSGLKNAGAVLNHSRELVRASKKLENYFNTDEVKAAGQDTPVSVPRVAGSGGDIDLSGDQPTIIPLRPGTGKPASDPTSADSSMGQFFRLYGLLD